MKKIVSIIVSLILCMALSITAFAQEAGSTSKFTVDGKEYDVYIKENICTVTDVESGQKSTYDSSTNILIIYENSDSEPIVINLTRVQSRDISNATDNNEYAYSTSIKHYNGKPYTFWQIQIPDEIKYTYETNNSSALIGFRDAVDSIKSAEDAIGTSVGVTLLATVLAVIAVTPISLLATAIASVVGGTLGAGGIAGIVEYAKTIKQGKADAEAYFNAVVPVSVP